MHTLIQTKHHLVYLSVRIAFAPSLSIRSIALAGSSMDTATADLVVRNGSFEMKTRQVDFNELALSLEKAMPSSMSRSNAASVQSLNLQASTACFERIVAVIYSPPENMLVRYPHMVVARAETSSPNVLVESSISASLAWARASSSIACLCLL